MDIPAVPQSPNPALRIVLPLSRSATASSASLKILDLPRTILGALVSLSVPWCVRPFVLSVMKERTLGNAATCHCLLVVVHAERGKRVLRRPLRAVADARVNARRDIAIVF